MPRRPTSSDGRVIVPLSRAQSEPRAYKMTIPAHDDQPQLRTHTGYEWLYVLRGRLRTRLEEHDFVSVEVLSLFGSQGERVHLRAKPRRRADA